MSYVLYFIVGLLVLIIILDIHGRRRPKLHYNHLPYDKPYKFKEHFIEIDGTKICYIDEGKGEPVLFVHGHCGGLDNWEYNISAVASRGRALALDLPGFGKSDKPRINYCIPYYADMVQKFILAMGLKDVAVVGNSMGGQVLLDLAIRYPKIIKKLILVDSAGLWGLYGKFLHSIVRLLGHERVIMNMPERSIRFFFRMVVHDTRKDASKALLERHLALRRSKELPGLSYATHIALLNLMLYNLRSDVSRISTPTLIVWGHNDRLLSYRQAVELSWRIPDSRLRIFDKCGHVPMAEKAEGFNRALLEFIM